MSPREKHVPNDAIRTSVSLTAADRAAIQWISLKRRNEDDNRTTINHVLVDAVWEYLKLQGGPSREALEATVPKAPVKRVSKVTPMPKPK
jgi:hypothetical protein